MSTQRRSEHGAAVVTVLLILLILGAIGIAVVSLVNRNTEQQAAHSKSVVGFYAAEAGLNVAAARVRNILLGFDVPTDCSAKILSVGNRTVTYALSGCTQTPQTILVPAGEPYEGLNAIRYIYDVTSTAANPAGFEEAILQMRFETRLIPMFQFAAFYKDDLELTVGPPMVIDGRMHTNDDLYLNTESCSPGARILGQVTVVNSLYRGRKDDLTYGNSGNVWINDPSNNPIILGRTGPGDTSCGSITTRQVSAGEASLWSGRIRLELKNVSLPGQDDLLCAPWSCPPGQSPGVYWERADLRIALNATRTEKLDPDNPAAPGPLLYALEVYNADGTVNAALTTLLRRFVRDVPGAITYSDVPTNPTCVDGSACESRYDSYNDYATPFPDPTNGCTARGPRVVISAANYCNDFRYGGFYNWRERKPVLMLNIDWMKLEEWNLIQPAGSRLFDPNDTSDGGLVVYTSINGATSSGVNNYGVRIYDAQRLRFGAPDKGITFASDQAAYVMGNFNCMAPGVVNDSVPAGCGSNGKKPAAVVADTLNVLSCAWIDPAGTGACRASMNNGVNQGGSPYLPRDEQSTNLSRPSQKPAAAQTFINAAFLAGNDTTTCPGNPGGRDCQRDYYSGGLENYPRFHERWPGGSCSSGAACFWYQGSFVAIDTPKHTCFTYNAGLIGTDDPGFSCRTYPLNGLFLQGYWQMQAVYGYSPPPRRWFYDVSFNDAANLPPLSPRFVTLRQEYFTELFR